MPKRLDITALKTRPPLGEPFSKSERVLDPEEV